MDRKTVLIIIAVLVVIFLYWTRFQTVELSGVGGFYKINRLTGKTTLVAGTFSQAVKGITETRIELQHRQEQMKPQGVPSAPSVPAPVAPEAPAKK
jgi:uncharacterized protein YaaQ